MRHGMRRQSRSVGRAMGSAATLSHTSLFLRLCDEMRSENDGTKINCGFVCTPMLRRKAGVLHQEAC